MERYWEVAARGVRPIMCNPEDLEKHSFRLYAGKKIFKDYSAAMLYWSGLRKKNKPQFI